MNDATLDSFDSESDSQSTSQLNQANNIGAATARRGTIASAPDRENTPAWGPTKSERGLEVRQLLSRTSFNGIEISPYDFRWVVGGDLEHYCTEYGTDPLRIPSAYSQFEAFDPYLAQEGTVEDGYGLGIDADRLEAALRLLTGGGRFDENRYNLLACGDLPAVLAGPEGTLLISLGPVKTPDRPSQNSQTTPLSVDGTSVSCEPRLHSETVRDGLVQLLEQYAHHGKTCSAVVNAPGDEYRLEFDPDEVQNPSISTDALAQIGRLYQKPENVPYYSGETVTDPSGTKYEVDWTPALTPDATVDGQPVLGYSISEHHPAELNEWVVEVRVHYLKERLSSLSLRSVAEPLLRVPASRVRD